MQKLAAVISVDVEQDCPPYLSSWRGVEEGLPRLLQLFEEEGVKATLFATGETYQKYPALMRKALEAGHELAVHGYRHERLDKLPQEDAARAVEKATAAAEKVIGSRPVSFRAPNLQMPRTLYPVLSRLGYRYDSSKALYKPPFHRRPVFIGGVLVIPATVTSSVLRLPWGIQSRIHTVLPRLRVYFSHPWEYIDMTKTRVRWDCRFNTGERAVELLRKLIHWLRSRGYRLLTLAELGAELEEMLRREKG